MSDPTDDGSYSTPDLEDVFQEDVDTVPEPMAPMIVPVAVQNIVRTDEMPCELGAVRNIILAGASTVHAEKVLNADPRRKRVIMWTDITGAGADGACIAPTQGDAEQFKGAIVGSVNAYTRWEFDFTNEIWARAVLITYTGGTWTSTGIATDDVVLNIVEELWSR